MTTAIIASDDAAPAAAPPKRPKWPKDKSRSLGANCDLELDLDRVIYDPEYRARVRDALNKGNRGPAPALTGRSGFRRDPG